LQLKVGVDGDHQQRCKEKDYGKHWFDLKSATTPFIASLSYQSRKTEHFSQDYF